MLKNKIFRRVIIFLIVMLVILISIGSWLPRYLILEEGINLDTKPKTLFSCLLREQLWATKKDSFRQEAKIKSNMNLPLEFFPEGKVTDIIVDELLELTSKSEDVLIFSIDEEAGESWLSINFEEDTSNNIFNRILKNWNRKDKEQNLLAFLEKISKKQQDNYCNN